MAGIEDWTEKCVEEFMESPFKTSSIKRLKDSYYKKIISVIQTKGVKELKRQAAEKQAMILSGKLSRDSKDREQINLNIMNQFLRYKYEPPATDL